MSVASEGEDDLSDEDEELDPRIQDGLEKLNAATNSINHLESELDEARAVFRQTMGAATYHLNHQAQKLGKCVDKARPFYESLRELRLSHQNLQKSALQFERANGMHVAAKARVREAEHRVFSGDTKLRPFDGALQELLNQATLEVSEAAKLKHESWERHQVSYKDYQEVQNKVRTLQKKLTSSIDKAKPYFEQKVGFDRHLWQLKLRVDSIHKGLSQAKSNYSDCLKSLEVISDEIHQKRKDRKMISVLAELHERGAGVGAESSTEDEASLSQSQLDLDLDCNTSLSEIDGIIPGETRRFCEASFTSQVTNGSQQPVVDGKAVTALERTVTGSESRVVNVPCLEREVPYGDDTPELKSEAGPDASSQSNSVEKCQIPPDNLEKNAGLEGSLSTSAASDLNDNRDAKSESDGASNPTNSTSDQTIQDIVKRTQISQDSTENNVEVECDLPASDALELHDVAEVKLEADGASGSSKDVLEETIQDVEQDAISPDTAENNSVDDRGEMCAEEERSSVTAVPATSVENSGVVNDALNSQPGSLSGGVSVLKTDKPS